MATVHLLPPPASAAEIVRAAGGDDAVAEGATPGTPAVRRLADSLRRLIPAAFAAALPVLLFLSPARYHVKRWQEPVFPRLAVVAAGEIPPEIRLRPVGTVR
jgi:flagellar biosynthesis protein FlhA